MNLATNSLKEVTKTMTMAVCVVQWGLQTTDRDCIQINVLFFSLSKIYFLNI